MSAATSVLERPPAAGLTTWKLDPTHTLAEFAARHMMVTTVKGRFGTVAGTIVADAAHPENSRVEATIDVASIDTREAQRDAHLRSADFFDVEHFPQITFTSRRVDVVNAAEGEFRVVGDLTIRDVTREVVLDLTYVGQQRDPWGGVRAGFSATTKLSRKDYGLTWNVALEAGGWVVGDQIKIALEVEAVQEQPAAA